MPKPDNERFAELSPLFHKGIVDKLKAQGNGIYVPSAPTLKRAAFDALKELIDGESEPVSATLAVNLWVSELHINESAFTQGLAREIEKGVVSGLRVERGTKAVAKGYME